MKAVRSSSPVSKVPSLSSSSHVFAFPVSDRGNIIRRTTSFSMSVFKYFTYSEEFVNVFVRIDFGSTIKLFSLDESQVVTFNGKFVCGFKNGDCGTRSRSDNTIGSPHGFIIYWIVISMNIKEVTEVTDVENWRIDNSQDNAEMEHTMDVDNKDGKYCLDDMSVGFEEDASNGGDQNERDTKNMTLTIKSHSSEFYQAKNMSEENVVKVNYTPSLKTGFRVVGRKRKPSLALQSPYE
nr:hypothetical protein [Tanacetum cinerariifolium]